MSGNTIGILQPTYLPWLGYFEQMAYVDHFVVMDDVQYTRHDWRNRNRIKTASGSIWLTVPVKSNGLHTAIRDIEINNQTDWRRKHLKSIELNYQRCPHFQPLYSDLVKQIGRPEQSLVSLNHRLTGLLCRYLDIRTPVSFASEVPRHATIPNTSEKNRGVIEICRHFNAVRLYDGAKARDFIDTRAFASYGIEVVFQDYRHPVYPQAFGEFVSHQSVVDLIMNTGPEAAAILRSSPKPAALRAARPPGECKTSVAKPGARGFGA